MDFLYIWREKKTGESRMGKCICCCKLERLNSFEDLIWFLIHVMEEGEFYEPQESRGRYIIHSGKVVIRFTLSARHFTPNKLLLLCWNFIINHILPTGYMRTQGAGVKITHHTHKHTQSETLTKLMQTTQLSRRWQWKLMLNSVSIFWP